MLAKGHSLTKYEKNVYSRDIVKKYNILLQFYDLTLYSNTTKKVGFKRK